MIIYYGLGCNKLYLHLRNNKSKRVRERVPILTSCQEKQKTRRNGSRKKEPETISHGPEKCLYFFSMFYRPFREPVETKVAEKRMPDKTKSLCGCWGTVSVGLQEPGPKSTVDGSKLMLQEMKPVIKDLTIMIYISAKSRTR